MSVRIVLVLFARLIDMLDLAHLKLAHTIGEGVTLARILPKHILVSN